MRSNTMAVLDRSCSRLRKSAIASAKLCATTVLVGLQLPRLGLRNFVEKYRRSVDPDDCSARSSGTRIVQYDIRDQIADPENRQQTEIELIKAQEHGGIEPERARIVLSARIEQHVEREVGGLGDPLSVFLERRDVVLPEIGLLQPVLIVPIEETAAPQCIFPACSIASLPVDAVAIAAVSGPCGSTRYVAV